MLRESYGYPTPELILIATGSEVHLCNAAADLLEADGISTRVVSAPCLDRFGEQDKGYRDSILPPACRARLAVEAASPLGWHRWVTDEGDVLAMETFGASGPQPELYRHFGFTPENIADRARTVGARSVAR